MAACQAYILSNLGDATFDHQAFSSAAGSDASHLVSVTLVAGRKLVCKEAAHKVRGLQTGLQRSRPQGPPMGRLDVWTQEY